MLIPLEIVAEILSNLDTLNLLNCRLVSRSWNSECLLTLKKKNVKVHLTLNKANIQPFLDFVTADSALKTTSCFEWKFEVVVGQKETFTNPQSRDAFQAFVANVNSLLNLFGPECVDKLSLAMTYLVNPNLLEFIANLSAGLSKVEFKGVFYYIIPESESARALTKFPKLKSIKFSAIETSADTINPVDFFGSENMETLEELKVGVDEPHWYQRLSFQKLANLEIVNMDYAPVLLYRIRLSPTPPILRKFSCALPLLRPEDFPEQVLIDILTSLRSTLKSFKFIVKRSCRPNMIRLPSLPHLEKFRIDLDLKLRSFFDLSISVSPESYHFTPQTLPALVKLDLPVGYQFRHWDDTGPEFPSVVRVTLRLLKRSEAQTTRSAMKDYVENLQAFVPNLRSMTVVKETLNDVLEDNQAMKNLLLGIMKSSRGSSLEELVIRNGDEDFKHSNFLGEILAKLNIPATETRVTRQSSKCVTLTIQKQSPAVLIGIQNVKAVRFEQFSSHADQDRRQARNRGEFHGLLPAPPPLTPSQQEQQLLKNRSEIGFMVQHFPHLVQLEMSPPFFGQTNKLSCFADIQELATKFPTLVLKLI